MKLLVVAVGHTMPAWVATAFDDYAKRFPPELRIELRASSPSRARRQDRRTA